MNATRPNILLVTTDQQRTDSLGCYGAAWMRTPHLDRLAREGVVYDRAYCTNPVCTPSRASIFSGLPVSRHGAFNVGVNTPDDITLISHRLGVEGYRTHYIGKAHFQAFMDEPQRSVETLTDWPERYPAFTGPYYGFETVELALGHTTFGVAGHYGAWVREQVDAATFATFSGAQPRCTPSFGGEAFDWHLPLRLHNSVWTADRTVDYLHQHDNRHPFLLAVGFEDPHHPHCLPRDFTDRVDPANVHCLPSRRANWTINRRTSSPRIAVNSNNRPIVAIIVWRVNTWGTIIARYAKPMRARAAPITMGWCSSSTRKWAASCKPWTKPAWPIIRWSSLPPTTANCWAITASG